MVTTGNVSSVFYSRLDSSKLLPNRLSTLSYAPLVDSTMISHLLAELPTKRVYVAMSGDLHGVANVDARLDPERDQLAEVTVTVQINYLAAATGCPQAPKAYGTL